MKIFHTADWHIGQTFYGYERYEEHLHFFTWLKEQLVAQQADVLLISGDIFDGPNPSAFSQKLYYLFLKEVTACMPSLQIVITAGNHDSAARLEAPNPLLEEMRVSVRGLVSRKEDGTIDADALLIPLYKERQVAAWCAAVPYLRQGDYPTSSSYTQGVQSLYELLGKRAKELGRHLPLIMMGHLQLLGSTLSENDSSERTLIGGIDSVLPSVFPSDMAYGALGHLHRAQQVNGQFNLRYAGAPIPMSFSEKYNKQGVMVIDLEGTEIKVDQLHYKPLSSLLSLPSHPRPIAEVLNALEALPQRERKSETQGVMNANNYENDPYLEVNVLLEGPDPTCRYKIEESIKGKAVRLARIVAVYPKPLLAEEVEEKKISNLHEIRPEEIALRFYKNKYGGAMPEELQLLLQEIVKEVSI